MRMLNIEITLTKDDNVDVAKEVSGVFVWIM